MNNKVKAQLFKPLFRRRAVCENIEKSMGEVKVQNEP